MLSCCGGQLNGSIPLLQDRRAFRPCPQDVVRRDLARRDETFADPQCFVEQWNGVRVQRRGALGACILQVGRLNVRGELSTLCIFRCDACVVHRTRNPVAGDHPRFEQRLRKPQRRFLTLRQRETDVGGERLLAKELVERGIGRVDQRPEVGCGAVECRGPCVGRDRRQEASARLDDRGRIALGREGKGAERRAGDDSLSDQGIEGRSRRNLAPGWCRDGHQGKKQSLHSHSAYPI